MTNYRVSVDGRPYDIEIEDEAPGRCRVTVDGRVFAVAVDAGAAGDAPRIEPMPLPVAAAPGTSTVPRPPATSRAAATAAPSANGATVLRAPMPGLILRVSVAPGAQVQRGQDIAVLEAMKMENIVRAPQAGTVAEVCVAPGDQVAHGAPIVRFAPASGGGA